MSKNLLVALAAVAVGLAACGQNQSETSTERLTKQGATVMTVTGGDTLKARVGGSTEAVRLAQIDAPDPDECWGREAIKALGKLAPKGTRITLERDPGLENMDERQRLLRVVRVGQRNVNLALVRNGDAAPYFPLGKTGFGAKKLMAAAESAQAAGRGAWGPCLQAHLDPERHFETGPAQ